jgi:glycosyltransferase involved in cell wall biosynthesis
VASRVHRRRSPALTPPPKGSLTDKVLAAGRRWAPWWIKHPVWLALQKSAGVRPRGDTLGRPVRVPTGSDVVGWLPRARRLDGWLAGARRRTPRSIKYPLWLSMRMLGRVRHTFFGMRQEIEIARARVARGLGRLARGATDRGLRTMRRLALVKHVPGAAARRLTPAPEWIRRSYQAHFSGVPIADTSRIRQFAEGTAATVAMLYLDRSYRKLNSQIHGHRRVPLLRRADFRRGSTLIVTGSLGPGGSERQIVTTLLGMVRAGLGDLSLVCQYLNTSPHDFYRCLLDDTSVRCSELRAAEDLWRAHDFDAGATAAVLNDILRPLPPALRDIECFVLELLDRRPEVVHAWLDETNIKAGMAAAIVGVPRIVLSTRSVAPANFPLFQPYMREAYRALARLPNVRLLNNSQAGARSYERWLGLPTGRFRVLPNGFDFGTGMPEPWELRRRYRARYGIDDSCLVLGSVMRFYEEKRPLLWFETAAEVARRVPEAAFLVIGNGPFRQTVRERAEQAGLGPRFFLPGHDENAIDAMSAMDVFLLTSRMEGLPNVLIEAQAMGIPVVTTDAGGASETLSHGETGYAIKPHSAVLLADAVVRIMADTAFRRAVRTRAPAFVRERFDVEQMVQETIAVYYDGRDSTLPGHQRVNRTIEKRFE